MRLILLTFSFFPLISFAKTFGQREDVKEKIKYAQEFVSSCFSEGLQVSSGGPEKLVLDWSVDENGDIKSIKVAQSTLSSLAVEKCVVDKFKTLHFPSAPKGMTANLHHAFVFQTQVGE